MDPFDLSSTLVISAHTAHELRKVVLAECLPLGEGIQESRFSMTASHDLSMNMQLLTTRSVTPAIPVKYFLYRIPATLGIISRSQSPKVM